MVAMLVCLVFVQAPAKPVPARAPRPVVMVPDPTWEPLPGARGEVIIDDTPACQNLADHAELLVFQAAADRFGIMDMFKQGRIARLEKGTPVLVITNRRPPKIEPVAFSAGHAEQVARRIAAREEVCRRLPVDVRILDGPHAGERWWVTDPYIGRLVPRASRKAQRRAATNQALEAMARSLTNGR